MAEDKIFEIGITSEDLQRLADLQSSIDSLRKANKDLENQGKKNSEQYQDNAIQIKLLTKEHRDNQNTLVTIETLEKKLTSALDENIQSTKQAKENTNILIKARDQLKTTDADYNGKLLKLNNAIDHNTNYLKTNTSAQEKQRLNIGNYKSALEGFTGNLKELGSAFLEEGKKALGLDKILGNTIKSTARLGEVSNKLNRVIGETTKSNEGLNKISNNLNSAFENNAKSTKVLEGALGDSTKATNLFGQASKGVDNVFRASIIGFIVGLLIKLFNELKNSGKQAETFTTIMGVFNGVMETVEGLLGNVIKYVFGLGKALIGLLSFNPKQIKEGFKDMANAIGNTATELAGFVSNVANATTVQKENQKANEEAEKTLLRRGELERMVGENIAKGKELIKSNRVEAKARFEEAIKQQSELIKLSEKEFEAKKKALLSEIDLQGNDNLKKKNELQVQLNTLLAERSEYTKKASQIEKLYQTELNNALKEEEDRRKEIARVEAEQEKEYQDGRKKRIKLESELNAYLKKGYDDINSKLMEATQLQKELNLSIKDISASGIKDVEELNKKWKEHNDTVQAGLDKVSKLVGINFNSFTRGLTTNTSEASKQIIDSLSQVSNVAGGIINNVFDTLNNRLQSEYNEKFNQFDTETQRRSEELAKLFQEGTLSEEEYNERSEALNNDRVTQRKRLENEFNQKQAEIQNAQFKAQKINNLIQAISSTALAVISALQTPPPFSFIASAIAGAIGASQIALIASQPAPQVSVPKYEEGGVIDLQGNSHSQGGIDAVFNNGGKIQQANLEGGEAIAVLNKNTNKTLTGLANIGNNLENASFIVNVAQYDEVNYNRNFTNKKSIF